MTDLERPRTCYPSEAPRPCMHKYALGECRLEEARQEGAEERQKRIEDVLRSYGWEGAVWCIKAERVLIEGDGPNSRFLGGIGSIAENFFGGKIRERSV